MTEENRDIMEQEGQEEEVFVPSPRWKRIGAWILFGIVLISLCTWLISIAVPGWTAGVKDWIAGLFA